MDSPMSVMPKPSVMPCTAPWPSETAATPASAAVATGSSPSATTVGERNTKRRIATTSTEPKSARRFTSPSIMARASAEKTPGPVISSCAVAAALPAEACALRKASVAAAMASAWASVSEPLARVRAMRRARAPSGETQTPLSTRGPASARNCSTSETISPVGSRATNCFTSRPACEARSASVSEIASRSPASLKRRSLTAGPSA